MDQMYESAKDVHYRQTLNSQSKSLSFGEIASLQNHYEGWKQKKQEHITVKNAVRYKN